MKYKTLKLTRHFYVKIILFCLFVLYTLLIIDFTLINDIFGRNISNIFLANSEQLKEYFANKTNIIPFATVKLFINALKHGSLEPFVVLENILGNFFVFMPFALLVPRVFSRINTTVKFLLFISLFVIAIELLQVVFLTGSADVDDFILNVGGALLAYGLLNVNFMKNGINKLLFGEANEN
ncbi:MAG: VanZ family protein [Clostridia bacterium]|nr:VanZ family protein [Clostridia bacterium]